EDGGQPELLFEVDDLEGIQGPSLLPGGEWLLFSRLDGTAGGTWNEAQVVI
ncbi:MAG: hypothetical protein GWN32_09640, partial [Gemmatimonadetes bacterium]|nr:hypothetical protein [Gemmatimonadota bacterium]